ncbi:MAG TPA: hypothetical protein VGM17_07575 [Rhizomicrobium sp.]|jgi:hypothetical protein
MNKRKSRYSQAEHQLAQKLFAEAKVSGTLKQPRAIATLIVSSGYTQSVTASAVTYLDYLPEARRHRRAA